MTEMLICDGCEDRLDETWTGPGMTIKDTTGCHLYKRELQLCPSCAKDVRERIEGMIVDV